MKQKAEPSVARCAFRRALAAGLPGVLPYLLALLLGFTVPTARFVLSYDGRAAEMAAEPAPALRELYHYVLFDADEFGWTPLELLALLTPVVLGVVLFAFLVRKRSAGDYAAHLPEYGWVLFLAEFEQERGQAAFFVPGEEAPTALREAVADS